MKPDTVTRVMSIETAELKRALKDARRVVPSKTSIPILSHVLIRDGSLTATDLTSELILSLSSSRVEQAGYAFTAPLAALQKAVAGADCGIIYVDELIAPRADDRGGVMRWVLGDMEVDLPCLMVDDFPTSKEHETTRSVEIKGALLRDVLAACELTVGNEETRYYLKGVYLHGVQVGGDGTAPVFTAVSTNGHQLTRVALPELSWGMESVIVPHDAIKYVLPLLATEKGVVQVSVDGMSVSFVAENWSLLARAVDGTFPGYARVIPAPGTAKGRSTMPCDATKAKVKRVVALSEARACAVEVDAGAGTLTHRGNDIKTIRIKADFSPINDGAHCPPFGINGSYLADTMTGIAMFDDTAVAYVGQSGDPVRFTPWSQPEGVNVTVVVMPTRV